MQCALWNEEWYEKAIDKVILSYKAMLELSGQKEGQSTLAAELLTGDLELQANLVCYRFSSIFFLLHSSFTLLSFIMGYFSPQIFIPIVHDLHWFLIMISREKTIYILDSFHSKSKFSNRKTSMPHLQKTLFAACCCCCCCLTFVVIFFSYDCSFHVLLYINGFDDKKAEQICGVNKVIQHLMMHAVT
jgi:hypothetical protein